MTTRLSVRQIKPTQAELRRILSDRKFAAGMAQRAWEEKQKTAWQAFRILCDHNQPVDKRHRALSRMLHNEHGHAWWQSING